MAQLDYSLNCGHEPLLVACKSISDISALSSAIISEISAGNRFLSVYSGNIVEFSPDNRKAKQALLMASLILKDCFDYASIIKNVDIPALYIKLEAQKISKAESKGSLDGGSISESFVGVDDIVFLAGKIVSYVKSLDVFLKDFDFSCFKSSFGERLPKFSEEFFDRYDGQLQVSVFVLSLCKNLFEKINAASVDSDEMDASIYRSMFTSLQKKAIEEA